MMLQPRPLGCGCANGFPRNILPQWIDQKKKEDKNRFYLNDGFCFVHFRSVCFYLKSFLLFFFKEPNLATFFDAKKVAKETAPWLRASPILNIGEGAYAIPPKGGINSLILASLVMRSDRIVQGGKSRVVPLLFCSRTQWRTRYVVGLKLRHERF